MRKYYHKIYFGFWHERVYERMKTDSNLAEWGMNKIILNYWRIVVIQVRLQLKKAIRETATR